MKNTKHIILAISLVFSITLQIYSQNDTINQRITLHNIQVNIIPPKHFDVDTSNNRISHQGTMSSIQIRKVNGRSFRKITSAMTKEYIAAQGFELLEKKEITMQDGSEAEILRCRFSSHDTNGKVMNFIRLMLFTGNDDTIWATADFPECMEKLIGTPIRNSITTISSKYFDTSTH